MLQTIVNLILCKCCKRKKLRVYASKNAETQTDKSIEIEIYSDDFESSVSPQPSPKKKSHKQISHSNNHVL